eukprot:Blabericola_migrator_1__2675@NODE_175_length_12037_cov_81_938346_g152_i0_p2_GENE_NODE_175_length_12037_cov_81_938346_g152_i0NODE_175_length_12037_cov_81_938346_g152_i0_p2_ORF_typecomplete_len559_score63_94_NODE_175_length_12037_cov_81_938346_g152_i0942111097
MAVLHFNKIAVREHSFAELRRVCTVFHRPLPGAAWRQLTKSPARGLWRSSGTERKIPTLTVTTAPLATRRSTYSPWPDRTAVPTPVSQDRSQHKGSSLASQRASPMSHRTSVVMRRASVTSRRASTTSNAVSVVEPLRPPSAFREERTFSSGYRQHSVAAPSRQRPSVNFNLASAVNRQIPSPPASCESSPPRLSISQMCIRLPVELLMLGNLEYLRLSLSDFFVGGTDWIHPIHLMSPSNSFLQELDPQRKITGKKDFGAIDTASSEVVYKADSVHPRLRLQSNLATVDPFSNGFISPTRMSRLARPSTKDDTTMSGTGNVGPMGSHTQPPSIHHSPEPQEGDETPPRIVLPTPELEHFSAPFSYFDWPCTKKQLAKSKRSGAQPICVHRKCNLYLKRIPRIWFWGLKVILPIGALSFNWLAIWSLIGLDSSNMLKMGEASALFYYQRSVANPSGAVLIFLIITLAFLILGFVFPQTLSPLMSPYRTTFTVLKETRDEGIRPSGRWQATLAKKRTRAPAVFRRVSALDAAFMRVSQSVVGAPIITTSLPRPSLSKRP